jgi:hypothetical protein
MIERFAVRIKEEQTCMNALENMESARSYTLQATFSEQHFDRLREVCNSITAQDFKCST